MKIKTSELEGAALDWAVAECEGLGPRIVPLSGGGITLVYGSNQAMSFQHWAIGGPIIEREGIELVPDGHGAWNAAIRGGDSDDLAYGLTPLIAAMRCYVASKLGEEVEVPNELVKG